MSGSAGARGLAAEEREKQRAAQRLEQLRASRMRQWKPGDKVWALCHASFLAEQQCMWYEATVTAAEHDNDGVWFYHVQYLIDDDEEVLLGKYVSDSAPANKAVLTERTPSELAAEGLAAAPLNVLVSAGPRRPGVRHSLRRREPLPIAPLTERPLRRFGRSEENPTLVLD